MHRMRGWKGKGLGGHRADLEIILSIFAALPASRTVSVKKTQNIQGGNAKFQKEIYRNKLGLSCAKLRLV